VATPWGPRRLILGQNGKWGEKMVPRAHHQFKHVVTPWESRRLSWSRRARTRIDRSTESSDDDDDESWEEERGPRQATPWAPRWSIGAPRFLGMPQWPTTIREVRKKWYVL